MYNEKKGSFIQFLKKPLTWIILVLTIISCIAIVNLPALYAYFSDVFVAHTSTIQFSDLSVKIGDKIYSKPLVYATGADNVESNPYKTLIEFTDNSENNNNILLADGYTVPIKYTITNDSKVTENITPEIKFTSFINNTDITGSENIITKMFTITQLTYSLDGQGNTKLISTDDISSNGTPGGSNTIATFKGATTLVKASESIEVVFRIKHNRESVKRGSAPSYLSRLKIETTAVATLPNNSAPNWDAKSEAMPFAIATYAFTNPAVLTKSSFNSDNITLADNTVTVKGTASTLIANWRPAVYECIINRTDYNAANPSGVENEVGVVNPEGNTFAVTYTDINIP
ncbi:MAG: hypothetical protein GX896_07370, partial [Clostridiales bacterium]|nr:hypothetical protein [Clostridiales bacterium]